MPKYRFERHSATTVTEIRGMIEKTRHNWLKSLVGFLYLYGCRISEALNLQRNDCWIEDNKRLAAKIGVLKRREKRKGPYKTVAHILRVDITAPFMQDVILPYLNALEEPTIKVWPVSRQLVWLRMKEVNVNISPHVFRHDRLMKLAERGATEAELMDWAGWSDPRPAGDYIWATGRLSAKFSNQIE